MRTGVVATLGACLIAFVAAGAADESVVRGRGEGTMAIPSANVLGNRNLTLFADLSGGVRHADEAGQIGVTADVGIGGAIGVADIMQFTGRFSAEDFSRIGPAEAHVQITTPRNDRLRFFGVAVRGDLYLATSVDTISRTTGGGKPVYSPQLLGSAIIDLDWFALQTVLPLKSYLAASLVDDPQLLYRYNQLAVSTGLEWKGYRHALFVEAGMGLYKEKGHRLNDYTPDTGYEQMYGWVRPGGRYRLKNRYSLVGSVGLTVYRRSKETDFLVPRLFSTAVRVEAPVAFRETNTEAIRTMLFVEKRKEHLRQQTPAAAKALHLPDSLSATLQGLEDLGMEGESFDYAREKEALLERREETRRKMEEIEALLNEIEE